MEFQTVEMQTRKSFIAKLSAAAAAITGLSSFKQKPMDKELKNIFIHHVYFWLKNADSKTDRDKLVEGLTKLSKVKTIQNFHIGKPADTNRDVIERGYAVSWFTHFANAADQASYQVDPIHLKFVEDYSHLWSKVIVYDSVDV
ncbi:stress responsive alpha/beta barrel protein [Lacibacter cauensis]|uniref:Stress responsive alpha/beta barrel protein n=2 Tax=Lacibacter cauensis TaxID=510947 RepID=A0A562SL51_9BACT|nr:stress responsive alpha/beta barrel protein [Lacibacter cauensis]